MKILVVGGTGFASGAFVREALASGHDVSVVTRGRRSVPTGVRSIVADRQEKEHFARILREEGNGWDVVVDYYAMNPEDIRQDMEVFGGRTGRLIYISTDFVYDPARREVPQTVATGRYLTHGYGGRKRAAEEVLLAMDATVLPWTIIRPNHIYGPGAPLGCLPCHARDVDLVRRIRAQETLRLVGGGRYRQQPVFAADLAVLVLSAAQNSATVGRIFHASGPEIIESWEYYRILADLLGASITVDAIDPAEYLRDNPDKNVYCCDRVYDLSGLSALGLETPSTTMKEGLAHTLRAMGELH